MIRVHPNYSPMSGGGPEESESTGLFTLLPYADGDTYRLINTRTEQDFIFKYRTPRLFKKMGGYRIESDWSGSAAELFRGLIPKLTRIHCFLEPLEEDFASRPDSREHSHGDIEYCNEFQTSTYRCVVGAAGFRETRARPEYSFSFGFRNQEMTTLAVHRLHDGGRQSEACLTRLFTAMFMDMLKDS